MSYSKSVSLFPKPLFIGIDSSKFFSLETPHNQVPRSKATSTRSFAEARELHEYATKPAFAGGVFWLVVSNIFHLHPYLGKIPILTNIFQMG